MYRQVIAAAYFCMRRGQWDLALNCLEDDEAQPPALDLDYRKQNRRVTVPAATTTTAPAA